jgi:hypothetical protein
MAVKRCCYQSQQKSHCVLRKVLRLAMLCCCIGCTAAGDAPGAASAALALSTTSTLNRPDTDITCNYNSLGQQVLQVVVQHARQHLWPGLNTCPHGLPMSHACHHATINTRTPRARRCALHNNAWQHRSYASCMIHDLRGLRSTNPQPLVLVHACARLVHTRDTLLLYLSEGTAVPINMLPRHTCTPTRAAYRACMRVQYCTNCNYQDNDHISYCTKQYPWLY